MDDAAAARSREVRSAAAVGRAGRRPRSRPQGKNAPKGLNENYGRELMELHTLGVDGGYTQKDVTEVARAFTGWTIDNPRQGGGFTFNPRLHDTGQKVVLGHVDQGGRRRVRRRAGARHPREASVDGALHRDQAGAPLRQRHAAAGARRSRRRAVPGRPMAICAR